MRSPIDSLDWQIARAADLFLILRCAAKLIQLLVYNRSWMKGRGPISIFCHFQFRQLNPNQWNNTCVPLIIYIQSLCGNLFIISHEESIKENWLMGTMGTSSLRLGMWELFLFDLGCENYSASSKQHLLVDCNGSKKGKPESGSLWLERGKLCNSHGFGIIKQLRHRQEYQKRYLHDLRIGN